MLFRSAFSNFILLVILQTFFSKKGGKRILSLLASVNTKDLAYLAELTESGKIKPVIDKTYSLEQIPDALRYVETGHARGKVVIRVNPM